jgi:signal transduction histidine kinase
MILFDNAKAAGASEVSLIGKRTARSLELTVIDNGKGIVPPDRVRIFEPFFTSKRAQGGTGLGLPIARALVKGHGGQLELADAPRGAEFRLVLGISRGEGAGAA